MMLNTLDLLDKELIIMMMMKTLGQEHMLFYKQLQVIFYS